MILQFLGGADVNRRGNHVVARLPHVDVIVGMNQGRAIRSISLTVAPHRFAITSFALVLVLVPEPV